MLLVALCVSAALAYEYQTEVEAPHDDEVGGSGVFLPNGKPDCSKLSNWLKRHRHYWYIHRYWVCRGTTPQLNTCTVPLFFQPSSQRCVFPWNWEYEPIRPPTNPPPPPPPSICENPNCDEDSSKLWPSTSPIHFWQCAPFGPVQMPCSPGTKFSFEHQVCVWPSQWSNVC